MLLCKEQKNPIEYKGRKVAISDKVANAHFYMCNLPVIETGVEMYVSAHFLGDDKNLDEKIKHLTDEELTQIVEAGVKDEFLSVSDENTWNSIEG